MADKVRAEDAVRVAIDTHFRPGGGLGI
jgi:hypothetical protein